MGDSMKIDKLSPIPFALEEMGKRLSRIRKQQGHSQEVLAQEAGIGVATLRRMEDGHDAQMSSWIKILGALDMSSAVNAFLPETFISPMAEVKGKGKRKQQTRPRSTGNTWGDETP